MGGKSLLSHDFKILYFYNPLNIGFLVFYLSRKRIHLNKITFEPNLGKGVGNNVIYSQDQGYSFLGFRILNPEFLFKWIVRIVDTGFKDISS